MDDTRPYDAPPGPPPRAPYLRVVSPGPGETLHALVVSHAITPAYVHYDPAAGAKGLTVPCLSLAPEGCDHCPPRGRLRRWWRGYVAVLLLPGRVLRAMDLTPGCCWSCPALLPERGQDLRGLYLRVTRDGPSRFAPVVARLTRGRDPGPLPAVPDMRCVMDLWWGLSPLSQIECAPGPDAVAREGRLE